MLNYSYFAPIIFPYYFPPRCHVVPPHPRWMRAAPRGGPHFILPVAFQQLHHTEVFFSRNGSFDGEWRTRIKCGNSVHFIFAPWFGVRGVRGAVFVCCALIRQSHGPTLHEGKPHTHEKKVHVFEDQLRLWHAGWLCTGTDRTLLTANGTYFFVQFYDNWFFMQSDTIILSVDYDPYQLQQMMDVCVWLFVGSYFGFSGRMLFCACVEMNYITPYSSI